MFDPNTIKLKGFEYTYVNKEWIWKSVPFTSIKAQEKPQIRAVVEIEKEYHKFFEGQLEDIGKDISRYLR